MLSLLYIDDEPGLLEIGRIYLENTGDFSVTTALSGRAGLDELGQHDFDAIVADYQMPEMDGIELLKKVRQSFGNIPFILFTGRGREEVVIEAINNGVDFYMQKGGDPVVQFAELAHKIRQAVNRRQAEIALSDSEKRLADIINFLPDATFAIDTDGEVIAWNRAMEEMTGVVASDILGKGDYEYALPFYRERRPLLLNLVLDDDPAIAVKYPHIKREGKTLVSEIKTRHFRGDRKVTLWFTASPLYNRRGDLAGAIESIRDITERKLAEEALNESEQNYRLLFETSMEGILIAQGDRMVHVNPAMVNLLGYPADVITSRPFTDFIHPDDRELVLSRHLQRMKGETPPTGYMFRIITRGGQEKWVWITSTRMIWSGKPASLSFLTDITERKIAEESLVSANREYTNLLDQIQDVYYRTDNEGRLVKASRSWATLLGYDDISDCIGRSVADDFYINPSDRKPLLDEIYRNGKITDYQVLLKKRDGTPVLVEASSHLYYNPAGKITGVEGTFRDITDRKKAEGALNESERRFRELADLLPQGIYEADTSGRMMYVNRLSLEMTGYTKEDIVKGLNALSVIAPEDRERAAMVFRQMVEQGARTRGSAEYKGLRKDGSTFPVSIISSAVVKDGRVVGVRGVIMDITEQKKAADELQAANEQLVATGEELKAQYDELAKSEARIRFSEARLTYMLGFYEYAQRSGRELLEYAIEGAGIVTGSSLGYLAFLNEDESELSMYAWSKAAMAECSMREKPIIYRTEKTGLWGEAVRQRRAVITNDYAAPNPAKKGYPVGHPHIIRHMNVPVLDEGRIVLVAGVANKQSDYTENDVSELLLLMQGLWTIIKQKRLREEQKAAYEQLAAASEELKVQYDKLAKNEERIRESEAQFRELAALLNDTFTGIKDGISILDTSMTVIRVNQTMETWYSHELPLTGRKCWEVYHGRSSRCDICPSYKTLQTRQPARDTVPWIDAGKHLGWLDLYSFPLIDSSTGEMTGVIEYVRNITAEKQAQEELKAAYEHISANEEELRGQLDEIVTANKEREKTERNFKILVDNAPDAIYIQVNNRFVYLNQAALRLFGASSADQLLGKNPWDRIHPSYHEVVKKRVQTLTDDQQAVEPLDEVFLKLDGTSVDVSVSAVPFIYEGNRGVLVMLHDISSLKRTETELRSAYEQLTASKEELRGQYEELAATQEDLQRHQLQLEEIAGTIPGVVYQFYARPDGSMGLYYVSSRAADVFGISSAPDDFFERFTQHVDPRDREAFLQSNVDVARNGLPWHYEGRFIKPSGEEIWFEGRSRPLRRGTELVFNGVLLDITDRKRAEEALRASEAKYRLLVENIPFGITLIDADHRIIMSNTAQGQMFHTDAGLWTGRYCYREFEKRDAVCAHCPGTRAMATGLRHVVETEGVRDDGTRFNARVHAIPLPDADGRTTRFIEVVEDITESKKAEEALKTSAENYQTILRTAMDGFCIIAIDGSFCDVNDAFCSMLGYTHDEALALSLADVEVRETPEEIRHHIEKIFRDGHDRFETRWRQKGGGIIDVEVSVLYTGTQGGQFITFGRDITERKRATEELVRLKISTDSSSDEVFWMDFDARILYVNDSACRATGYSREELTSMKIYELDPDFPPEVWEASVADLRQRKTQFITTRHRRKDGSIMDVEIVAVYVNQDGREYSFAYVRDITGRKRAEEILRESEAKFRAVIDQSFEFIGLMSTDGMLIDANRSALEFAGIQESDVINRPFWETPWWTHSGELRERLKDAVQRAAAGETVRFEATHPAADGHIATIDFSLKPVVDAAGKILYLIPEGREITERKQAEEQLSSRQALLDGILQSTDDGILVIGDDGKVLAANNRFRELWRIPENLIVSGDDDALLAYVVDQLEAPEDFLAEVKRLYGTDEEHWGTIRFKDGRYFERFSKAIPFEGRRHRLWSFRDVTHRKRAEDALRESEKKFRQLITSAPLAVGLLNSKGEIEFINNRFTDLFGYSHADVPTLKDWIEKAYPDDEYRKQALETWDAAVKKGLENQADIEPIEYNVTCKDGSVRNIIISGITIEEKLLATFIDVTERRIAEDAMRESEEKYRSLAENTADILFSLDTGGVIKYVSPQISKLGYSPEELTGTNFLPLIHPEDRKAVSTRFKSEMISGDNVNSTFRLLDRSGAFHWVEERSNILFDDQHRPIGLHGVVRDIADRKQAEDSLRESEEKYRTLVESSFDGIAIHQDGIVVYANRTAARLLGSDDPGVFIGKPAISMIAPAFRELILKRMEESPKKSLELIREQFVRLDGTLIDVDVTTTPTTWQGRPAAYVTFRDITAQVKAEEALRESEEKYRTLVEINRDIIYSLSTDGTILYVSPQTIAQLGYRPDEMEGRTFSDFVHPDDLQDLVDHIQEHFKSGKPARSDQFRLRRKDGTYRGYVDKTIYATDNQGRHIIAGTIRDITEEKAAQDALRESEEKFRALVETTSDFIWEVDAAGVYTYVSPQVRQILGYEPEDLLGKTPFDIMPAGEAERVASEFRRSVESRLPIVALENKAIRKDGSVVILETSGVVRTAKDGRFLGYRGIDRDITKRKQAEEALRESEARLSSILHGSPVLQFVINRNHQVISWNKALEEYSGIRAAEIIGTDQQWRAFYAKKRPVLADLLVDGDTDAISRLYAGKLRKSRYVEGAFEATDFFPHMGRSGIWLSFTAAPIRDIQGTIIGAVETLEDVTERINAENALRESDKWTRTILNTAQAGIILVDANTHQIVDANRKALELIGLDRDSVIGTVCHRFICPAEEGKCPVTDLDQAVDTSERVLLTASGEKIPVLKTVVHVSMSGRDILVESFVDISERKRSEDAIREANRKLNLLNSITRHDIRNQLMVAQGYAQLAAFSKPEPVVADFLNKIATAVQTIQRQIEFTKEYQELGVHAPAWFMIRNVISTVRPEKIAVRNTCNSVEIFADPMIDKVFYNLFDNAVKYGERVTTVRIGCEETEKGLVITFADNGVGIPAEEKHKIFEKGYGRNTGFGLFLVREILAITGITIEETGTEGKGAVFEITVPKGVYRKTE